MRRLALYGSAAVILFSLIVTVARLTTHHGLECCPQCGAPYLPGDVLRRDVETTYMCRRCTHAYDAPPNPTFNWLQSVEHWLGE